MLAGWIAEDRVVYPLHVLVHLLPTITQQDVFGVGRFCWDSLRQLQVSADMIGYSCCALLLCPCLGSNTPVSLENFTQFTVDLLTGSSTYKGIAEVRCLSLRIQ